jgi:hypothetical protein
MRGFIHDRRRPRPRVQPVWPMIDSGPCIKKIERLEDELEVMRQRLDEAKRLFGGDQDVLALQRLGLSPSQARAASILLNRPTVTAEQMGFAVYIDDPDRRHELSKCALRVHVSKARERLRTLGVRIEDGRQIGYPGYRMPADSKAYLRSLMARPSGRQAAE